ncbi:MAG: glutamate racemase [Planctomycetes bacterium]|nr:glutamate racemase [Planctomycetota bacterium]MCD7897527.1 glutamate racemase [Planctomycetaceae bacterium]
MALEILTEKPEDGVIAVYDSGLGGLSILRELERLLPDERLLYFADNIHMPYGPRPLDEVRGFALLIADHLLHLPAKAVVVACNTASAAALHALREAYPNGLFVGMEPAVKPAAAESRSGRVGVLATQATFQGELFESVVERFAQDVVVVPQPCPGLAEFIENHPPDHPVLDAMVEKFVQPLIRDGVDMLVLGCTHYALVKETIQRIAGPDVTVVDPSPAVARRTRAVLEEAKLLRERGPGEVVVTASGETERFSENASVHLGRAVKAKAAPVLWIT